mmetsp:Transcript_44917/g.106630  ORF Transcript_44917/g.106630 Transcript_44917/m.106630 type:complete len:272 (+) Transcript_44917:61-876(+)
MNGPNAQALRDGGAGGSLRYKRGTTVECRLASGAPIPAEWKRKTKLQEAFGDYGDILRIDVAEGAAFIEYEDKRDAEDAAANMNGKKVCGHGVSCGIAGTGFGGGDVQGRVAEMSQKYGLDAASSARLVSVFTERVRLGCELGRDISELSEHLAASNKPSALVCMKLAELRTGQPIGPCKFKKGSGRGDRQEGGGRSNDFNEPEGRSRERSRETSVREDRGSRSEDHDHTREERGPRDRRDRDMLRSGSQDRDRRRESHRERRGGRRSRSR